MKTPNTPEQVEQKFKEALERYRKQYQVYLETLAQKCDCDRMSCARCYALAADIRYLDSIMKVY
jgi:Tfp pilus assembly protein PilN